MAAQNRCFCPLSYYTCQKFCSRQLVIIVCAAFSQQIRAGEHRQPRASCILQLPWASTSRASGLDAACPRNPPARQFPRHMYHAAVSLLEVWSANMEWGISVWVSVSMLADTHSCNPLQNIHFNPGACISCYCSLGQGSDYKHRDGGCRPSVLEDVHPRNPPAGDS